MELQKGDWVQAATGEVGEVVTAGYTSAIVEIFIARKGPAIICYLVRQLTKIEPPEWMRVQLDFARGRLGGMDGVMSAGRAARATTQIVSPNGTPADIKRIPIGSAVLGLCLLLSNRFPFLDSALSELSNAC
jgi:hypothetical protein